MAMKKLLIIVLCTMIALGVCCAGAEQSEAALIPFYDAAEELLCRTENVTLNGKAVFSLDGETFKTAVSSYVQDGRRSVWDLRLSTPLREDNGFVIYADGLKRYVREIYCPEYPDTYITGTGGVETAVLRPSVRLDLMKEIARQMTLRAEEILPAGAFRLETLPDGGTQAAVTLDGDIPMPIDAALNLGWQFIIQRYFYMNYDQRSAEEMPSFDGAVSVWQGLLGATSTLTLKSAAVTMTLDAEARLTAVNGMLSVWCNGWNEPTHRLDITFSLDVTDRGASAVRAFDPEALGLTLREHWADFTLFDEEEEEEQSGVPGFVWFNPGK